MRYLILAILVVTNLGLSQDKKLAGEQETAGVAVIQADKFASQTQRLDGKPVKDQPVLYRFRLGDAEAARSLEISNFSGAEGSFILVVQTPAGQTVATVKQGVPAGESLSITAAEAKWAEAGVVQVKAARRLGLVLRGQSREEDLPIAIDQRASVYDICTADRLPELGPSGEQKRADLLTPRGRTPLFAGKAASMSLAVQGLAGKARGGAGGSIIVLSSAP